MSETTEPAEHLPASFPSPELKAIALQKLQEFEQAFLSDPVHGYRNPFCRPGLTASALAYACGLVKDGETGSGRTRADTPAARRLLKAMVAEGLAESTGRHRTLQCGSQGKECFAPQGFAERLDAKLNGPTC